VVDRRRIQTGNTIISTRGRDRGFSMVDLLVSIAVIALLIGIITPTLAHVKDAADKVVCASNLRQVGLGLTMYADDHEGRYPEGLATGDGTVDPQIAHTGEDPNAWNGLGWLVADGYLSTPQIFYCPAHQGEHTAEAYADGWMMLDQPIRTNYAYRGVSPQQTLLNPADDAVEAASDADSATVLIADGFSTSADFNHENGFNTLNLGLSVAWLSDESGTLRTALLTGVQETEQAWSILDNEIAPTEMEQPGIESFSLFPG
jgi:type II secretory pathway pseudopilin PulG